MSLGKAGTTERNKSNTKKEKNKRVSEKIDHLVHSEGKTPKQAVGMALGMERSGGLRRHGKYVPVDKRR